MHQRYRAKGIFIKKQNQGEADQLLTIFTEQFGKIEVLAKGIRKITSKLRAGADVFYLSEIEFVQAKSYKILTDALVVDKLSGLRASPNKLFFARAMAVSLDNFLTSQEKDGKIWQFVESVFNNLNNQPANGATGQIIFYHYFLWNFFAVLGYSPELCHCPLCSKKLLPETFFFVPSEGGVVCWQCFSINDLKKNGSWLPIKVDVVKTLRVWLSKEWTEAGKIRFSQEAQQNICDISENYLGFLQENIS